MAQLHFDCFSGISGDMILGALVDAGLPLNELARALKAVPVKGYTLRSAKVQRGGLQATKVEVVIRKGAAAPFSLAQIRRLITASRLPEPLKATSRTVFERLAKAEGVAHRISPSQVQFHELGVIDSLVDVIGSLLGCHLLGIQRVTASPVNLGSGMIHSSHGTLPAPGPAVAELARGVPVYSAGPQRELTTPTGIALLTTLAAEFGPLPLMRLSAIGYGAGTADPEGWPNALRVFLGEPVPPSTADLDTIVQIETNLDDLNPQVYEMVIDRLFAAGAVDVALVPAIMKQGRPGMLLSVLAPPQKAEAVIGAMLQETTTLGVRTQTLSRRILPRRIEQVSTQSGPVRIKVADLGQGQRKAAPEYQDCKRLAEQSGRPVREIMEDALLAWRLAHRGATRQAKGKSER